MIPQSVYVIIRSETGFETASKPFGQWNQLRLVVHGKKVEHWLNGERVLNYELESPDWLRRVADAPRFANVAKYGRHSTGKIALQSYSGTIRYRNIRLLNLTP